MHVIDPNAIYSTEEVMDMLSGVVKLDTLRAHGLVALPGAGYWGADLIYAINTMQEERRKKKYGKRTTAGRSDQFRHQPRLLVIKQAVAMEDEPELPEAADPLIAEVTKPSPTSPKKRPPPERRQAVPNQKLKLRELAAKLKE